MHSCCCNQYLCIHMIINVIITCVFCLCMVVVQCVSLYSCIVTRVYVYKRLQQFRTRLTGLRKDLVTVNVHFYVLYLCVRACVCVHVHCVVCFVSVCPTSCLAYCFGTCSMVSSVFTYFRIYIFVFIITVMNYVRLCVRLLELLGLSAVLDAHYYYCCCCCYY